jgi:hypothetical protein
MSCFNLSSEYYASPWLLTFFAVLSSGHSETGRPEAFDLHFTLTVIDLYLLEGSVALVRVCLGILEALQEEIEALSYEETLVFMKSFQIPNGSNKSLIYNFTTDSEGFFSRCLL